MAKKQRYRPKLELARSPLQTGADVFAIVGVVLLIVYPLMRWGSLPASVPTHFDAAGNPDAWGERAGLLLLPIVGAATFVGLTVLARFPHVFNYPVTITPENAPDQYRMAVAFVAVLKAEMVWLFALLEWGAVEVALGERSSLGGAVTIGSVAAVLGTTVVYVVLSVVRR